LEQQWIKAEFYVQTTLLTKLWEAFWRLMPSAYPSSGCFLLQHTVLYSPPMWPCSWLE